VALPLAGDYQPGFGWNLLLASYTCRFQVLNALRQLIQCSLERIHLALDLAVQSAQAVEVVWAGRGLDRGLKGGQLLLRVAGLQCGYALLHRRRRRLQGDELGLRICPFAPQALHLALQFLYRLRFVPGQCSHDCAGHGKGNHNARQEPDDGWRRLAAPLPSLDCHGASLLSRPK